MITSLGKMYILTRFENLNYKSVFKYLSTITTLYETFDHVTFFNIYLLNCNKVTYKDTSPSTSSMLMY